MRPLLLSIVAIALCACHAAPEEQSVKPGINTNFLDPNLEVDKYVERFETESREVFAKRTGIARAIPVRLANTSRLSVSNRSTYLSTSRFGSRKFVLMPGLTLCSSGAAWQAQSAMATIDNSKGRMV